MVNFSPWGEGHECFFTDYMAKLSPGLSFKPLRGKISSHNKRDNPTFPLLKSQPGRTELKCYWDYVYMAKSGPFDRAENQSSPVGANRAENSSPGWNSARAETSFM